ncbi:hypothetical protein NPIL_78071 [Nephila pilipes]|uniref:Uncharacterized protein n=1 Tax=Nephila pilipes TaxID=299642 RepID=A0A8X6IQB1_NEPPI|nr:hypothetical protein NPIL_78071 [Nephila pilipes]
MKLSKGPPSRELAQDWRDAAFWCSSFNSRSNVRASYGWYSGEFKGSLIGHESISGRNWKISGSRFNCFLIPECLILIVVDCSVEYFWKVLCLFEVWSLFSGLFVKLPLE